ncbi:NADPH:quinone oxidoreductase family protein [Luteipulveratus flavus]|uniref:NADPH:quinone oxidoreductase family protein n=1 Tax=Luteipulveratus flavus TaxID=3031728 RepID=A0ABT6C8J3_9MICO|nr:NADPH:quinone oxidoreductase family protein [Luteipulveratus sp. YIM 133296]MDF8265237.1 NADPH:quinone oxidoreductase family protein [Luteipulveratus sp. YIM 133296]
MRAVQVTSLDGPRALRVGDVPEPARAEDQVLVQVHRAGVAYPDVLLSRGEYQFKPELPFVLGAEVSGVVLEAPSGSSLTPGQHVAAFPAFGGFAERVALPEAMVFPLPDGLSLEDAAALPMNYLTCVFALLRRGRLAAGETVLVHGASGGIGTAAIQVAKASGASVIAVVSTQAKRAVAQDAGADHVVLADGFRDAVKELTSGRGADIVVDPVGGDRFTDSLRSLAPEGRLLVIGFTGGEIPTVKVNRLLHNNTEVIGVGWGAFWLPQPQVLAGQWQQLMRLWDGGGIKPVVGGTYELDQVGEALTDLDERRAQGKVLLRVTD